ncbi:MAG: hypothetical protein HRT89_22475 [Lentisphaeria bacterium]|nr:hypothetical protein [Lentisphaeria bacterium]NQZ70825.1 hypothetical protein [Lentisphaeria bacterium]
MNEERNELVAELLNKVSCPDCNGKLTFEGGTLMFTCYPSEAGIEKDRGSGFIFVCAQDEKEYHFTDNGQHVDKTCPQCGQTQNIWFWERMSGCPACKLKEIK